jgi:hypothetical protein
MGAEAHWLMGRVMPRDFVEEVGKYLHHVAPDLMFSTLNERKNPLDKIEKACRKTVRIYPPTSSLTSSDCIRGSLK